MQRPLKSILFFLQIPFSFFPRFWGVLFVLIYWNFEFCALFCFFLLTFTLILLTGKCLQYFLVFHMGFTLEVVFARFPVDFPLHIT